MLTYSYLVFLIVLVQTSIQSTQRNTAMEQCSVFVRKCWRQGLWKRVLECRRHYSYVVVRTKETELRFSSYWGTNSSSLWIKNEQPWKRLLDAPIAGIRVPSQVPEVKVESQKRNISCNDNGSCEESASSRRHPVSKKRERQSNTMDGTTSTNFTEANIKKRLKKGDGAFAHNARTSVLLFCRLPGDFFIVLWFSTNCPSRWGLRLLWNVGICGTCSHRWAFMCDMGPSRFTRAAKKKGTCFYGSLGLLNGVN